MLIIDFRSGFTTSQGPQKGFNRTIGPILCFYWENVECQTGSEQAG